MLNLGSNDPIESRELAVYSAETYRNEFLGQTAVMGVFTIAFAYIDGPEDIRVSVAASVITVMSAFGTAAYACVFARRSRDLEGARESLA